MYQVTDLERELRKAIEELKKRGDERSIKMASTYEARLKQLVEKVLPVYEKTKKGEPLTLDDLINAMSLTCFGNIMYCCAASKPCPWRDSALSALGIDEATYTRMKRLYLFPFLKSAGVNADWEKIKKELAERSRKPK